VELPIRRAAEHDSLLAGYVIGITAERRAHQQVDYLTKRGASVVEAQVLRTIDQTERPELWSATARLIERPPDVLVVQTGQGLRWWLDALEPEARATLLSSLTSCDVWCRGSKATSACRAVGLDVAWEAPNESTVELLDRLESPAGNRPRIAVQLDGNSHDWRARARPGVDLLLVDLYRYELPDDLSSAHGLIDGVIAGTIDAVTFTASPAIRHLREIAVRHDAIEALDHAFRTSCLASVVGPVCAETAREAGWTNIVEPPTEPLVQTLYTLADPLAG